MENTNVNVSCQRDPSDMESKQPERRNLQRRKFIDRYMPTIKRIVLNYNRKLPPHIDIDDLVSAGVIGLLKAMESYDPERGVDFGYFVNYHIKGSILDELRSYDHLTRDERRLAKKIQQTCLELEQKLQRQPRDEEIAREMQLPLEKYYKHKELSKVSHLSYEDHWDVEEEGDPIELIFHKELKLKLTSAISGLPEKQQSVIDLYYFKRMTKKEIAGYMGLSEGRVSQLHKEAMVRLERVRRELE